MTHNYYNRYSEQIKNTTSTSVIHKPNATLSSQQNTQTSPTSSEKPSRNTQGATAASCSISQDPAAEISVREFSREMKTVYCHVTRAEKTPQFDTEDTQSLFLTCDNYSAADESDTASFPLSHQTRVCPYTQNRPQTGTWMWLEADRCPYETEAKKRLRKSLHKTVRCSILA